MFNLGEYDEEEAKEIWTILRDAGIRVELKPFLVACVGGDLRPSWQVQRAQRCGEGHERVRAYEPLRWEFEGEIAESEIREKYLKSQSNII